MEFDLNKLNEVPRKILDSKRINVISIKLPASLIDGLIITNQDYSKI